MYQTGRLIPCCAPQDYGAGVDYTRPPPAGSNSTGGGADPSLPNFGAGDMPLPADLAVRFQTLLSLRAESFLVHRFGWAFSLSLFPFLGLVLVAKSRPVKA